MSTCPEVPSFSGIRVHPSAPKRAVPLRRPMPKARQASASASAPVNTKAAATPKDPLKPRLSSSSPVEPPHRDDGPEEGEISDEEDDHYSPAEATTPVHVPFVNPFEKATSSKPVPPNPPFVNADSKSKGGPLRKEQSSGNMSQTQDLQNMSILELRKSAQAAVMYLACSAKMSFDDIVSEGIDRRVVASYFSQLKLPMPTSEPRDTPLKEQPKPVSSGKAAAIDTSELQSAVSNSVQPAPINNTLVGISSTLGQPPSSLPPRPPPTLPIQSNNTPKPESVVSRFNQSLPGLNILQQANSPLSTPPPAQVDATAQDISSSSSQTNSVLTVGARNRKRPVAADFDTETKPASLTSKQARFGNRELLETSNLVFDVSDNEDGDHENSLIKQVSRVTSQTAAIPSRPDSTTPEDSEKINESIRLKEAEIELMRQKIKLMTRKRKLAGSGDSGSGPPTKPSTPLPSEPPVEPGSDKQTKLQQVQKLEQVEQFLHQTLDQIEAGNTQLEAAAAAAISASSTESTHTKLESTNLQPDQVIQTIEAEIQSSTQDGDVADKSIDINDVSLATSSNSQLTQSEKAASSEESYETAAIESEAVRSEDADDGQGEPMDLSDLSSASGDLNLALEGLENPLDSKGSGSDDISDDISSEDSLEDIEMLDGAGTDSVSSPMQEPEDESYDPESRELDIGEVSLPSGNAKLSQVQPLNIIEMGESTGTTGAKQEHKDPEFRPYQSALTGFKSFRYHPSYSRYVSQGFKSLTYSNHIDSELPICDFETRGGTCNDPQCRWQHFRQMALPGAFRKRVRTTCNDTAETPSSSQLACVSKWESYKAPILPLALVPTHCSYPESGTLPGQVPL
ncbi:zinc finger, C3H1-type containing, variant 2 [Orbilia brochopaga]|uniref:Zinc finger, C3H1-type containing, variant 2 n=1 Tax=Orbilia brochopaga TaxID=3140254 RepID=A0AAV9VDK7_9PEZI